MKLDQSSLTKVWILTSKMLCDERESYLMQYGDVCRMIFSGVDDGNYRVYLDSISESIGMLKSKLQNEKVLGEISRIEKRCEEVTGQMEESVRQSSGLGC